MNPRAKGNVRESAVADAFDALGYSFVQIKGSGARGVKMRRRKCSIAGDALAIYDALQYAPGPHLYRVDLGETIVPHGTPIDKYASSERTAIAYLDATDVLRAFARSCALDVIHLWDAPDIVRRYLETGDESLRAAAWDAADAAQREWLEAMILQAIEEKP